MMCRETDREHGGSAMIDSFRRAIYHTLKAAWYRVFGEPPPHVHRFEPYWTAPHELVSRCVCGEIGPHICRAPGGVCIWCDPRVEPSAMWRDDGGCVCGHLHSTYTRCGVWSCGCGEYRRDA